MTPEQHYHGLESWVADYKAMRKAGNVKDAIVLRDKIKDIIETHNLDPNRVWGSDPDDPRNFKRIPKFVADDNTVIEFVPLSNVPGFTHRVVINGCGTDWLGDNAKPNAKAAAFFYGKHILGKK